MSALLIPAPDQRGKGIMACFALPLFPSNHNQSIVSEAGAPATIGRASFGSSSALRPGIRSVGWAGGGGPHV